MLLAVVLLVNLLIAIFSNVFTEIEAQSLQFWMSTKYYLLLEYKAKTIVPAPFGVIQVVLEVVAYLMTLCVDAMRRRESPFGSLHVKEAIAALYEGESSDEEDDDDDDDLELSVTELQYWAAHQVLQREAVDETNRLDSICKMVENVHKTLVADGSGSELKAEDKGDLVARETTELSRTDSNQHVPIGKSSIEVAE
uniref:Ion_trans domain-containing protein n=1 Tax=Mesocestoides corti TaxID=53468 RepID=A0A5K3EWM6_MESCO